MKVGFGFSNRPLGQDPWGGRISPFAFLRVPAPIVGAGATLGWQGRAGAELADQKAGRVTETAAQALCVSNPPPDLVEGAGQRQLPRLTSVYASLGQQVERLGLLLGQVLQISITTLLVCSSCMFFFG